MRTTKIEVYRDGRHEWRWRLRASNGRILVSSGGGYRRRASALRAIDCVQIVLSGDISIREADR